VYVLICLVAVTLLVSAEYTGPQVLRIVAKTTASLAFLAQGIASGADPVLLFALGASVVGDVCLLFRRSFLPGIVAFGLAHVGFCAAFLEIGVSAPATIVGLAGVGGFGIAATRTFDAGPLQNAVRAYAALISTMTALAIGVFAADPSPVPGALLAAAVVFLGSDLLVARDRFVRRAWLHRAIGLPMYYGAQLVLATVVPELLR